MSRFMWALGLVLVLAACGGGSKPSTPRVDPNTAQTLTGLTAPTFTDAQIVPTVAQIFGQADTLLITDIPITYQGQRLVAETTCSRSTCDSYEPVSGVGVGFDLTFSTAGASFSGVGEKDGVSLAQGSTALTVGGNRISASGYGGWLDYSYFDIQYGRIDTGELRGLELALASSLGNDTGSRPTGNATWNGLVVGGTDVNGTAEAIQGDASLTYNMASADVDVSFSNIYNLATRNLHVASSMSWQDVPVGTNGYFGKAVSTVNNVIGRFYGPGHTEVGGIFHHPTAIGSFGAKR